MTKTYLLTRFYYRIIYYISKDFIAIKCPMELNYIIIRSVLASTKSKYSIKNTSTVTSERDVWVSIIGNCLHLIIRLHNSIQLWNVYNLILKEIFSMFNSSIVRSFRSTQSDSTINVVFMALNMTENLLAKDEWIYSHSRNSYRIWYDMNILFNGLLNWHFYCGFRCTKGLWDLFFTKKK